MEDRDYIFERRFFQRILAIAKERGMSYMEFSGAVWEKEGKAQPYRSLISLRKVVSKTGKPQALKLREAYRMCRILNVDFSKLAWEIETFIDSIG